jgi:protein-tyrosine phosphatase
MKGNKISVIFVCLGNICRSPLAEAIFNHKIRKMGLSDKILASSAGTAHWHIGESPDPRTIEVAERNGVPVQHRGYQLKPSDFNDYDYFLAMDDDNFREVSLSHDRFKSVAGVYRMRDFDDDKSGTDVPDPYYGDMDDFEYVFKILDEACGHFVDFLRSEHNLE